MPHTSPLVLIVDDDLSSREMYAEFLTLSGFGVALANDGVQALDKARELAPAVVVTDLGIPGIDGLELCRRLRREERTKDVPVIAVTGRQAADWQDRATEAGISHVLTKPCLPDSLLVEIRRVLSDSRRFPGGGSVGATRAALPRGDRALHRARRVAERKARMARMRLERESRRCPGCGRALAWTETRTLDGQLFDYYRWCEGGCGLFYYDHARGALVKMAG